MVEQIIDFLEGAVLQFRDIEVAPDCSEQRGTAKHEADFASEVRLVGVDLEEGESQRNVQDRSSRREKSQSYVD